MPHPFSSPRLFVKSSDSFINVNIVNARGGTTVECIKPPRPTPLWSTRLYSKSPTVPLIPAFTVPELHSCTGIRGERRCLPIWISGAILIRLRSHRLKASCILVPTKLNLFRTKPNCFFFFLSCFVVKNRSRLLNTGDAWRYGRPPEVVAALCSSGPFKNTFRR